VRDPVLVAVRKDRNRASAQMSFIRSSRPGQHRRLRPFRSRSPTQRHDVESVASTDASPVAITNLLRHEKAQASQKTGTSFVPSAPFCGQPIHGVEATADRHPAFNRVR